MLRASNIQSQSTGNRKLPFGQSIVCKGSKQSIPFANGEHIPKGRKSQLLHVRKNQILSSRDKSLPILLSSLPPYMCGTSFCLFISFFSVGFLLRTPVCVHARVSLGYTFIQIALFRSLQLTLFFSQMHQHFRSKAQARTAKALDFMQFMRLWNTLWR